MSGDGSVATWEPDGRGDPVRLQGQDFAGNPVDTGPWVGDVVVVNTWYAACPPCRVEAPDLAAAATDYADDGVRFLGINGTDDAGAAQPFERTFDIPYPSIADADGTAIAALQGRVPVEAVPTTVVLDRQGRVSGRILGVADPTILRDLIDDVLDEPA
nr:TlpA disulfide reductase family protein [Cellulomonas endophytica]